MVVVVLTSECSVRIAYVEFDRADDLGDQRGNSTWSLGRGYRGDIDGDCRVSVVAGMAGGETHNPACSLAVVSGGSQQPGCAGNCVAVQRSSSALAIGGAVCRG